MEKHQSYLDVLHLEGISGRSGVGGRVYYIGEHVLQCVLCVKSEELFAVVCVGGASQCSQVKQ